MHEEKLMVSGNKLSSPNDCWQDGFSYCETKATSNFYSPLRIMVFHIIAGEAPKQALQSFKDLNKETLDKLKNIGIETIFIFSKNESKVEILGV